MKHWHVDGCGKLFTSFTWALARCAVLMSEDHKIRKPAECETPGCMEGRQALMKELMKSAC